MRPSRHYSLSLLALAIALSVGASASADEYYFLAIFGSQSQPKRLKYTHTWATFIRAVGEGPDLNSYCVETNTISWLPRSLEVKVWSPWPEPGVNMDLHQTLQYVTANRESITMWGPFVCQKALWDRSLAVRDILEGGTAQYRAISTRVNLLIADCIHAVAAVDPIMGREHYPLLRVGKPASRYIAREIMQRSLYDQYQYDASWLIPRLALDPYQVQVVPPQAIPKVPCGLCKHEECP